MSIFKFHKIGFILPFVEELGIGPEHRVILRSFHGGTSGSSVAYPVEPRDIGLGVWLKHTCTWL